jgi:hypothetical protein
MGKNLFTFAGERKPRLRVDFATTQSHQPRREQDQGLASGSCPFTLHLLRLLTEARNLSWPVFTRP